MNSIRGRFLRLNLISILICVITIGGLGLWSISVIQKNTSRDILTLTCGWEGQRMDGDINSIRDSVNLFCEMTDQRLPAPESLRDPAFAGAFFEETERNMGQIARVTHGVCAYYFRIELKLTEQPEGFFYARQPDTGRIEKEPMTDITAYDPSDIERVGWYYKPQVAGKPIWMEPYFNKNLGIYMVSYVVPLYRDGVFWAIAGMDIDFDIMIDQVKAVHAYETGYAFLCSDQGAIYYHPELPVGSQLGSYIDDKAQLPEVFRKKDGKSAGTIVDYHYKGMGKSMTAYTLNNGMELVLAVNHAEIKAPLVALFRMMALVMVLLGAAVSALIIHLSNRITRPLESLTQAAREIADGNLDVTLPEPGSDEVGILTRSFQATVSSLKRYVASMNDVAFTDSLTQVKNKAAYDRALQTLQQDIDEGHASFGFVMLDLNNLKSINDHYGHERGDEYIIGCSNLICEVFNHSPVFRVGGDEFVVILSGDDLEERTRRVARLNRLINKTMTVPEPWRRLSIAKGVAVYGPEDIHPESVFVRADEAMYEDKLRMKNGDVR